MLFFQSFPPHKIALLFGKADSEPGQGHSEDGDLPPLRIHAKLVAIQGQTRLQTQGVPGAQAGRLCAQLNQPLPEPGGLLITDVDFVTEGFAGIAGMGHMDAAPLEHQGAQGIAPGLGGRLAASENLQNLV